MDRLPRRRASEPQGLGAFLRAHRWALASGLSAVAIAGACQVPFDYDRSFGASLWCESAGPEPFDHDAVRALADHLRQRSAAEQVAIRIDTEDTGDTDRTTLRIDLWGEGLALAPDALLTEAEALATHAPVRCKVEPHVETVHGTLGGHLGLELFDLELLDHHDAAAARAQILERLEARGLRGDAEVEISDHEDGRREIKIRIDAEEPGPPG